LAGLSADGALPPGSDPGLLAEALGSMTEQLAYVQIGLARELPRPEAIEALGRTCGQIWHRAVFGAATTGRLA
jgi:hypothetical protein